MFEKTYTLRYFIQNLVRIKNTLQNDLIQNRVLAKTFKKFFDHKLTEDTTLKFVQKIEEKLMS